MPRKRKVTPELREKARELRESGKSFPEIADELGLTNKAARAASRKPKTAGAAAPSSPAAPDVPPPARVQVAPAPEAAPLPSPDPPPAASTATGPDILDQLKAEGIDLGPRGPAVAAPPDAGGDRVRVEARPFTPGSEPPPPPGARPGVDGEQLIEFSETVKGVNVLLQCERFKVKLPPEILEQLTHFSPGQRKALLIFAPYAAPYVTWLISHHDKVAGILFLVVLAAMIVGDAKTIKGLAPKKEPEEKPKAPAPAAAPPATS